MSKHMTIRLGFEVGTGVPVQIPLAHTFVTGQTQLSGKTTTLRAIVDRSGCRALAFVTKRGESLAGRRIRPYLPREGDRPIPWRLVETILASALGQRAMKYERLWIVNAAKGARSLADVRANVTRLRAKAKGGSADMYMLLGEYLDLVLPEMQALAATDELDLMPGLNVMDLAGVGAQLQALVIRAALERINAHETGVLTVFPEAWEFAPRDRMTPAKDAAAAMARKGAVLGNWLLCDSQDIAGVDTTIRQAASVWLVGVQREANELKRTLAVIRAGGTAVPKPADVVRLEVGEFYACYGRHAIRTYVQPPWLSDYGAAARARRGPTPADPRPPAETSTPATAAMPASVPAPPKPQAPAADDGDEADTEDDPMSRQEIDELKTAMGELADAVRQSIGGGRAADFGELSRAAAEPNVDEESLYQRFKARLVKEAPAILRTIADRPEIHVQTERTVIQADKSVMGRVALLISGGFFREAKASVDVGREFDRRGWRFANVQLGKALADLTTAGAMVKEDKKFTATEGVKIVRDKGE